MWFLYFIYMITMWREFYNLFKLYITCLVQPKMRMLYIFMYTIYTAAQHLNLLWRPEHFGYGFENNIFFIYLQKFQNIKKNSLNMIQCVQLVF